MSFKDAMPVSGQNCYAKYEKLLNIVIHAYKNITEKRISWKCVARKFGVIYLLFDPLRQNS